MYFNRRLLVVIALTALLAAAGIKWWWSAVSVEQTLSTPHLIVGVVGDPAGLNDLCPDGAVDRVRYLPQSAVYESPVSYDSTRGIRPLLLSDWRVASDARSVDLVFKKNVRFHNGKEMSALTVKQCWETTLSRAANTETAGLFSVIAGSQSYLKGETQDIPGLQVVSSYVLRVKFVSPQSYFISSLAHPAFWVYDSTDKATFAPGTGPFSIQEVKDNLVRVDAFTRYHDDGPQISGIEFQVFSDSDQALTAYQEGKLSLLDAVQPAQVKALGKDEAITRQLIRQPLLAVYGVAFNLDKEPWHNNYLLRRALNYAIDRQAIVRDIFAGGALSCVGPLPTGLKPAKAGSRGYDYNPELAGQLLREAGYPDGDGLPGITLYYLPDSGHRQLAVSVAEQLGTLGVEIYPRPLNEKSMVSELSSGRFESSLIGWQVDYPEVYAFLSSIYNNGVIGYQNAKVKSLLTQISRTNSKNEKEAALLQSYKLIADDAPMLWLCQPQTVKLAAPVITGIEVNGLNQIDWNQVQFSTLKT